MSDKIRIRVYNVRFGDAILVTVPDRGPNQKITKRHLLIDVGNVLSSAGGDDTVFESVVKNILKELGGEPLDLYVMTHEHLDHVQGLLHAAKNHYEEGELAKRLHPRAVWLTGSAHPDYYDQHPQSRRKLYEELYPIIAARLAATGADADPVVRTMLLNNNPRSTKNCVDYLRALNSDNTHYIHRQFKTEGKHPFREARFEIWAPEEDTSSYYRKLSPMTFGAVAQDGVGNPVQLERPLPPPGVDATAFYDLVRMREAGTGDNLLAIDKAANDTSVVFALDWRGRTLLFAGDAEVRSWRKMQENGVLRPVDFLKVSHHGSHNGTPEEDLLDGILPKSSKKGRTSVISTWADTYGGIPHNPTNEKLGSRSKLKSVLDDPDRPWFDTFVSPREA